MRNSFSRSFGHMRIELLKNHLSITYLSSSLIIWSQSAVSFYSKSDGKSVKVQTSTSTQPTGIRFAKNDCLVKNLDNWCGPLHCIRVKSPTLGCCCQKNLTSWRLPFYFMSSNFSGSGSLKWSPIHDCPAMECATKVNNVYQIDFEINVFR